MFSAANTGFMLLAASLVMLMTPGLAFFYGGLVGRSNTLTIMIQSSVGEAERAGGGAPPAARRTPVETNAGHQLCYSLGKRGRSGPAGFEAGRPGALTYQ